MSDIVTILKCNYYHYCLSPIILPHCLSKTNPSPNPLVFILHIQIHSYHPPTLPIYSSFTVPSLKFPELTKHLSNSAWASTPSDFSEIRTQLYTASYALLFVSYSPSLQFKVIFYGSVIWYLPISNFQTINHGPHCIVKSIQCVYNHCNFKLVECFVRA